MRLPAVTHVRGVKSVSVNSANGQFIQRERERENQFSLGTRWHFHALTGVPHSSTDVENTVRKSANADLDYGIRVQLQHSKWLCAACEKMYLFFVIFNDRTCKHKPAGFPRLACKRLICGMHKPSHHAIHTAHVSIFLKKEKGKRRGKKKPVVPRRYKR